jgi:hypothetical protein
MKSNPQKSNRVSTSKQFKLFNEKSVSNCFGGVLLSGKRKSQRPLSFKRPIHIVFRSDRAGRGKGIAFSPRDKILKDIIKRSAERYGVKVYSYSINWNHFHFVALFADREKYTYFVRYLSSQIVAFMTRKFKANLKGLFTIRPFTRIVSWGKDFQRVCRYVLANVGESFGYGEDMLTYSPLHWRAGPIN